MDPDGRNPWAISLGLKVLAGATALTGAVLTSVGLENTGKGVMDAGNWISDQSNKMIDYITPEQKTIAPFPVTQGEGINQTTPIPTDATGVKGNLETLIEQGKSSTVTLESSSKQNAKQVAKLLGIPLAEAHNKLKEIKKGYDNNPDIKIGKMVQRLIPTSGKNKGKEFDSGSNVNDYKKGIIMIKIEPICYIKGDDFSEKDIINKTGTKINSVTITKKNKRLPIRTFNKVLTIIPEDNDIFSDDYLILINKFSNYIKGLRNKTNNLGYEKIVLLLEIKYVDQCNLFIPKNVLNSISKTFDDLDISCYEVDKL